MSLFSMMGPTDGSDYRSPLNSGPQLQYEGGPAAEAPSTTVPREMQVLRPGNGPQLLPGYPAGDQPTSLFSIPVLNINYQSGAGSTAGLITPSVQDWFDNNVARLGGPVTLTELDNYLLSWADDHIARPAGPIASDSERTSIMRAIGIPLGNPGSMSTIPKPARGPAQPTTQGGLLSALQVPEPLGNALSRLAVDTTALRTALPAGVKSWMPLILAGLALWALA